MRGPLIALCFVSLSLAWLVFLGAGVKPPDWDATLLFLGATALFYWLFRSGQTPPRLPVWQVFALWSLPAYAVFQLVPLPPGLLSILSPARAVLTGRVAVIFPTIARAPIAVAPAAAVAGLFGLLGYLTVFSLMRDIAWRYCEIRPWLPPAPLVVIAALESAIGVGQWLGSAPNLPMRGTLASAEYFAALMEIALPFSLIFGFVCLRRHQQQGNGAVLPAAMAVTAWGASLLIFTALVHSPSQTSHVALTVSLFVLMTFAIVPRLQTPSMRRYATGGVAFLAVSACFIAVPPFEFVNSLASLGASPQASAEQRLSIWAQSVSLLDDFHWFGTGIGGFASSFPRYQSSGILTLVQTPHNDVLGMIIAFGIVGSVFFVAALIGVIRPAILGAIFIEDEARRLLAAAITASLAAVVTRSCLESTLSAPAIATAFAWLAGLSQSSGID